MTCPCGVCEERFIECHAECDAFKAWSNWRMEQHRKKCEIKNRENMMQEFKIASIKKTRRRRK